MPSPEKTPRPGFRGADFLQELVDVGTRLAGARHGALGVLNERGDAFSRFVTCGISKEMRTAVPFVPTDRGLLAAPILDSRPLRTRDILRNPGAGALPENRLPVNTLLALPVLAEKRVLGGLYFAEKIGAPQFRATDIHLMQNFANLAADLLEGLAGPEETGRFLDIFRDALETDLACLITDPSRRIVFWNREAHRLFGHAEEEALGRRFEEVLVPPEEFAGWKTSFIPRILREFMDGKEVRYEAPRLRKDGRWVRAGALLSPVVQVRGGIAAITVIGKYEEISPF